MTRNIVDIINEKADKMAEPTPTEKAQIVVTYSTGHGTIYRFSTVKKGEKEYKMLLKEWHAAGSLENALHEINGDMFIGTVDLAAVVGVAFIDHAKRNKFVPIPA